MPFIPSTAEFKFDVELNGPKVTLAGREQILVASFERKPETLEVKEAFARDGKELPTDCWHFKVQNDSQVSLRFKRDAFGDGLYRDENALADTCLRADLERLTTQVLESKGARNRYAALSHAAKELERLRDRSYLRMLRAVLEQEAITLEVAGQPKDGSDCRVTATLRLQPRISVSGASAMCMP